MSKMIAVRIEDALVQEVDRARRRRRMTRASVIRDALSLWVNQQRLLAAIRRDQEGYAQHPVTDEEFGPVLGAQAWPK